MTIQNSNAKFSKNDIVEVYYTKNAIHIRKIGYSTPKKHTSIINLSNGLYLTNDGYIKHQKHSKMKIDNSVSLNRTFHKLRRIIEDQVDRTKKAKLSLTLTYRDGCTDTEQLQHDFDIFMKRLRRYVKKNFNGQGFSFIKIFEPHEEPDNNGKTRWHIHLLLFGLYFLDKKDATKLWGHADLVVPISLAGRNPLSVAQYFTGYVNLDANTKATDELTKKRLAKQRRLKLYPRNLAIYSTSRDIHEVKWQKQKFSDIIEHFPDAKIVNSAGRTIIKNGKEINRIDYLNLMKASSKFMKDDYKPFDYKEFE